MRHFIIIAIMAGIFCSGCVKESSIKFEDNETEQQTNEKEDCTRDFSYIESLPDEKIANYERFALEKETDYLQEFSPEEIVLVYLHSVTAGDVEAIYALTYHDSSLPSFMDFTEEYNAYLSNPDLEMALRYRYFDSIEVDKENSSDEDETAVKIKVGIGIYSEATILGLKKQNNSWKMDTYHSIEYYRDKNLE